MKKSTRCPLKTATAFVPVAGNALGLDEAYPAHTLCALIHAETATVLATYGEDFYAGRPAITVNDFGSGKAYYLAARTDAASLGDFYRKLVEQLGLVRVLDVYLPAGVSVTKRGDGETEYIFIMNFSPEVQTVPLDDRAYVDVLDDDKPVSGGIELESYGIAVLRR